RHQWPLPGRLDHPPLWRSGAWHPRDPAGAGDARLSRRTRRLADAAGRADRGAHAGHSPPRARRMPHLCQGRPMTRLDNSRSIAAPRGTALNAKSWLTEAPLRMLMNNLDAEVAENPHELVVYGGIGRAARDWESYDRIVETLKRLGNDETLLVQSGKPVGVFRTHPDAPRVLLANSNLVGSEERRVGD